MHLPAPARPAAGGNGAQSLLSEPGRSRGRNTDYPRAVSGLPSLCFVIALGRSPSAPAMAHCVAGPQCTAGACASMAHAGAENQVCRQHKHGSCVSAGHNQHDEWACCEASAARRHVSAGGWLPQSARRYGDRRGLCEPSMLRSSRDRRARRSRRAVRCARPLRSALPGVRVFPTRQPVSRLRPGGWCR